MKNWGIRAKVLVLALLPMATTAVLLASYFILSALQDLEKSLTDRGYAIVRQLAPAAEYGVSSGNAAILQMLVDAAVQESDVRSVLITDAAGNMLALSGPNPMAQKSDEPRPAEKVPVSTKLPDRDTLFRAPIFQTELAIDSYLEKGGLPLIEERPGVLATGKILGWVSIEMSREATQARRTQILVSATLITAALLALVTLLALRMSRTIVHPILSLTEAVRSIEAGKLDIRLQTGAGAELAELACGVNAMALALKTSQENLQDRIEAATEQLLAALDTMEEKNAALDTARREAESAMRVKSDFVARMSHEMRTPLNGILGFLDLLSKTGMDSAQRDFVSKIAVSSKSLRSVINDILDFSKLEAGKLAIQDVKFELREMVDDAVASFASLAHGKGLELVAIVDAALPNDLVGAVDRITQVLNNLLSNAIKFTVSGSVVLRTSRMDETARDVTLRFAVSDTAGGIPAEQQKLLFQPFTQLETGTNRSYGGTGLGLVIAKSLVEGMGGDMALESRPGDGSCFSFTLKLQKQHSNVAARNLPPLTGGRVLVISRSEHLCLCVENQATALNVSAKTVRDTVCAARELQRAGDKPYNLIIVDDELPSLRSAQIARDIRSLMANSPFVLALLERTSNRLRSDAVACLGFDTSLVKPLRHKDLRAILARTSDASHHQASAAHAAALIPASRTQKSHRPRVLLADDNEINRHYLATVLQQMGATTEEAIDGEDAIEACRHNRYDIVLMDVHMPRVDGCEAATRIRQLMREDARMPIIAITADVTHGNDDTLRACDFDDHLIKPVSAASIRATIDKWFPQNVEVETDTRSASRAPHSPGGDPIIDRELGLRFASGDSDRWQAALQTLAAKFPQQLGEMKRALAEANLRAIGDIAHHIHGSASYCGTLALRQAAQSLEAAARAGNLEHVTNACAALELEVDRLMEKLRSGDPDSRP